ncbi:hypothetical protein ACFL6I_19505 [candidate division KSB1 bacterium]
METTREGRALKVKFGGWADDRPLDYTVKKAFEENGVKIVEKQTPNLMIPECGKKLVGHWNAERGTLYVWDMFYRGMPEDIRNRLENSLSAIGVPDSYAFLSDPYKNLSHSSKKKPYEKPSIEKAPPLNDITL